MSCHSPASRPAMPRQKGFQTSQVVCRVASAARCHIARRYRLSRGGSDGVVVQPTCRPIKLRLGLQTDIGAPDLRGTDGLATFGVLLIQSDQNCSSVCGALCLAASCLKNASLAWAVRHL